MIGLLESLTQIHFPTHRAAYVREATRFKPTRASVNVPARNAQVIERTKREAVKSGMPVSVAGRVYEAVIEAGVRFEECVFDAFNG
ncbi:hypothetical protein PRK78_005925 [Emydomyces testavorans]|uniref:Chorismate mutase domain-containing protein n=1 Tax=Emydomyces testavorans TaxID=2070801 RepID=A0AAF0DLF2_9EURO|nr:hypothetical protein PRK78_005925 [Emydomyces testavorans]